MDQNYSEKKNVMLLTYAMLHLLQLCLYWNVQIFFHVIIP